MTKTKQSSLFIPRGNKRRHCLGIHELYVFGVAVLVATIQHANGFVFPRTSLVNQNYEKPLARYRWSFLQSQATPYFVDPKGPLEDAAAVVTSDSSTASYSSSDSDEASLFPGLLKLASMHCASQALNTAVRLKIPDLLGDLQLSVEELAVLIEKDNNNEVEEQMPCHRDALFRTLRLLTTIDVVKEEKATEPVPLPSSALPSMSMSMESSFRFSLTPLGKSLRTSTTQEPSMASCVKHWMEEPLWDSWLELPDYIREGGFEDKDDTLLPFERANGAVSSDDYYNKDDHPESLQHANEFVRLVHNHELRAVVEGFDWSMYSGQRLVDIAGNNGKLAEAIVSHEPTLKCSCLDLPSVIDGIPTGQLPQSVTLVPGNVLDPSSIPDCEVILMKHFCDRCMWFDDQTVEILRSCKTVLERSSSNDDDSAVPITRKIMIADAVLPDCGTVDETNELPLYLDAMYMLVGRERQRTRSEWKALAEAAGLTLASVIDTGVPTCSLIVLEPPKPELLLP